MTGDGDLIAPDGQEIRAADADPVAQAAALADWQTIGLVRTALDTGRLRLAFQPVVLARDPRQALFHEALIRVLDPSGRIIPAREFMPAVEDQDLGRLLDCASLSMALDVLRRHSDLRLSVNMSARSIGFPRWTEVLRQGLAAGATVGERLVLEIDEPSVNLLPEITLEFMNHLQPEGVSFALDGFGAGLTALHHFRAFPFDIIKVDGRFTRALAQSPDNQMLLRAFALLARHFDLIAVGSAVESGEEVALLTELGLDALQGYHLGAPTVRPAFLAGSGAGEVAPPEGVRLSA